MQILVCNHAVVPNLTERWNPTKILTILEPEFPQPYLTGHPAQVHRIDMVDLEDDSHYLSPSPETVRRVLYLSSHLSDDDRLLIHCYAGKSRSTAAAAIIIKHHTGDIARTEEILRTIRPGAAPNTLLCKHADDVLNPGESLLYDMAVKMNAVNEKHFDGT